jgi:D-sedoheptulose 7-phosphate isomerase
VSQILELINRCPKLESCCKAIEKARDTIIEAYRNNAKVLVCGNGGSCADAEHIAGELMKGFLKKRPVSQKVKDALTRIDEKTATLLAESLQTPLRAISLCGMPALSTAIANDINPSLIFAQQVLGLTDPGDVFIGISTSGNAANVRYAAVTAKALKATLIGFTGEDGGSMNGFYDTLIKAPEKVTHRIQEMHQMIYHALCIDIEDYLFLK